MGGRVTKLVAGGGEVVAHSSVQAFQGLSGAVAGKRSDRRMSQLSKMTATPMRKAPIVSAKLMAPQPGRSGYVYVRRAIPISPRMCMGKNVRLKPMVMNQN